MKHIVIKNPHEPSVIKEHPEETVVWRVVEPMTGGPVWYAQSMMGC
jgi:hypothetical protein